MTTVAASVPVLRWARSEARHPARSSCAVILRVSRRTQDAGRRTQNLFC